MEKKKAYLLLANGQVFEGQSFGAEGTTIGEIVFTTGMTGYQETLTDPSYYGQIAVQTFPLIGNYGINSIDSESDQCWMKGYIAREFCEIPSNFRCETTIEAFLDEQGIIGLCGIDTRALTRVIREFGVMNGMITTEDVYANKDAFLEQINSFVIKDAVKNVTVSHPKEYKAENGEFRVVLMDFGYKRNILRKLMSIGCDVTVVPADTSAKDILAYQPDGIMLSNGPGDPEENTAVIATLQELIKSQVPIFGICLGHQLMALANGAKTYKLKYGHHGSNQPVKDIAADRVYVTSQNHNYAVDEATLDAAKGQVSHFNVNDKSCEGIIYTNAPAFTVQFHPEACSGPKDTMCLFGRFADMMKGDK